MDPPHSKSELTSHAKSAAREARNHLQQKVHRAAPWLEKFARMGYFCKGVIYLTIAFLSLKGALQGGRSPADARGALEYLGRNTFSDVLLVVLAVGLVGYSMWQLLRSFLDPEGQGHQAKGVFKRIGYFFSSMAYLTLAWAAVRVSLLKDHVWDQQSEEQWVQRIFDLPAGRELVTLIGVAFLAVAANQIYVALRASFMKRIESWHLKQQQQNLLMTIGRIGILARGLVAGMIGWLLLKAAYYTDADQAGGMSEAIRNFENAPGGVLSYTLMGLGMLLYGMYAWIQAAYRKIPLQEKPSH